MDIIFKEDLQKADPYETGLIRFAMFMEGVEGVRDVRNKQHFQKIDIDFVILKKTGEVKVEAKIDFYNTKNFWFEMISDRTFLTKGCILKTKSDELWYYCVAFDKLYIIPTNKLKKYLNENNFELTKGGDNALGIKISKAKIYKQIRYKIHDIDHKVLRINK